MEKLLDFFEGRYNCYEHTLLDACKYRPDVMIGSLSCKECSFFAGQSYEDDSLVRIACYVH